MDQDKAVVGGQDSEGLQAGSYEVTFARLGAAENAAQAASRQISAKTPSARGRSKFRLDRPPAQQTHLHRQGLWHTLAM